MAGKKQVDTEPTGFVTTDDFNNFKTGIENSMGQILELMKAKPDAPQTEKQKIEKAEAKSAEPNDAYLEPVPPAWVTDAKEKIGEAVDHCELDYIGGRTRYTVVIKNEFSNAPKATLDYYKVDRRTVVVENGIESVRAFNTLVAKNLQKNPKVK